MNLFGLTFEEAGANFHLQKREQEWVEEMFFYLLEVFGLPDENQALVLLNTDFFPLTVPEKVANMEDVLSELCGLLQLNPETIRYTSYEAIIQEEAYEELSLPYEMDTLIEEKGPRIVYREKLLNRPKKLLFLLLFELLHLTLRERNVVMKMKEDIGPFMTQLAVFGGFGVLAARNLYSVGEVNQQYWQSKWVRPQILSDSCMAYGLALYAYIRKEINPEWAVLLPKELRPHFREALGFVAKDSTPFDQRLKFQIITRLERASRLYRGKNYTEAIACLSSLIEKNPDASLPARVYGNLGYYLSMERQFEKSIPYFEKAIELKPDLSYVHDNLGYAFLQLGKLKQGKEHISKSLKGMKNDIAYSFRNLAVYHQLKGEPDKAAEFFDLSYENKTQGVDLLDYHYAEFLWESGKKKKAKKYMQKAVELGEPVAIERMEELF